MNYGFIKMEKGLNSKWIESFEGFGVGLRIFAIAIIAVLGTETPFASIWGIQLFSAFILLYCAWKRMNRPYIILNAFYSLVSIYGIYNSL